MLIPVIQPQMQTTPAERLEQVFDLLKVALTYYSDDVDYSIIKKVSEREWIVGLTNIDDGVAFTIKLKFDELYKSKWKEDTDDLTDFLNNHVISDVFDQFEDTGKIHLKYVRCKLIKRKIIYDYN